MTETQATYTSHQQSVPVREIRGKMPRGGRLPPNPLLHHAVSYSHGDAEIDWLISAMDGALAAVAKAI